MSNSAFAYLAVFLFFNTVLLPEGLLYTSVFFPFLVYGLRRSKWSEHLALLFLLLVFYAAFHFLLNEIYWVDYFQSAGLFFAACVSVIYAISLIQRDLDPDLLFKKIIILNFLFFLVAVVFKGTSLNDIFWSVSKITKGAEESQRLKLFVYEPSYYSTLMVPFLAFFLCRFIWVGSIKGFVWFLLVLIPVLASFSMGVLSALLMSFVLVSAIFFVRIIRTKFAIGVVAIFLAIVIPVASTDNLITQRLENVMSGDDSSGNNRLIESPLVALDIAKETDLIVGAGFGQSKYYASYFFEQYWPGLDRVRLTNSVADTLSTLGVLGVFLRFGAEIALFFYCGVYRSYFRSLLFFHGFIYQFTGSFLINTAEFFIWMLAFVPVFYSSGSRVWVFEREFKPCLK